MFKNPKTRYAALGSMAFALFGFGLMIIGGRLCLYQRLLDNGGQTIIGVVTSVGTTYRSSGGNVDFIRYRFQDESGKMHAGVSSGYSGEIGETVLLEYAPSWPFVHRVAGEGKKPGYQWRWAIFGGGFLFFLAGVHWWTHTWRRTRLALRLAAQGIKVQGVVKRIADGGRTIMYEYHTPSGRHAGKTMALPEALVKNFKAKDPVEALFDPDRHNLSVLKMEL